MGIQGFLFTNKLLTVPGQYLKITFLIAILALFQGCVAVNTFPQIARPGDTVSVMIGGTELERKDTISVILTDSQAVEWDLQALGLVRSVFNLRPEGRAHGLHYSEFTAQNNSWKRGHEPLQTVLVIDVPDAVPFGPSTLEVTLSVSADDDSSGVVNTVADPFTIALAIVDVTGQPGVSDNFITQTFDNPAKVVDFGDLEPAPHAKISFGRSDPGGYSSTPSGVKLHAAEIVVDFDQSIVSGDDLNVYVAEPVVRGSLTTTGAHGKKQRMVSWKHDDDLLTIYVIAPTGIGDKYLQVYIVHPKGLSGDPGLSLLSTSGYDVDGNAIVGMATPQFSYFPQ